MTKFERTFIFLGIGVAIALSLGWRGPGELAAAKGAAPITHVDSTRIATFDVLMAVERLVGSEKYVADRDAHTKAQNDKLQPLLDSMNKLKDDAKDLKEDSEKYKQLSAEFAKTNQEFGKSQQQAAGEVEGFNTRQISEAYRLVCQAAEKMAADLGYTHLIASKRGDFDLKSINVAGAVQEILARPVVKGVEADDLTDRLLKELKLDAVVAKPAGSAAGSTGAAGDKK